MLLWCYLKSNIFLCFDEQHCSKFHSYAPMSHRCVFIIESSQWYELWRPLFPAYLIHQKNMRTMVSPHAVARSPQREHLQFLILFRSIFQSFLVKNDPSNRSSMSLNIEKGTVKVSSSGFKNFLADGSQPPITALA